MMKSTREEADAALATLAKTPSSRPSFRVCISCMGPLALYETDTRGLLLSLQYCSTSPHLCYVS